MALDTVAARLDSGYYRQLDAFRHDVTVVHSNCVLFNGRDSEYTANAAELEGVLVSGLPPPDPTAPVPGIEPTATVKPAAAPPAAAPAPPSRGAGLPPGAWARRAGRPARPPAVCASACTHAPRRRPAPQLSILARHSEALGRAPGLAREPVRGRR